MTGDKPRTSSLYAICYGAKCFLFSAVSNIPSCLVPDRVKASPVQVLSGITYDGQKKQNRRHIKHVTLHVYSSTLQIICKLYWC